MPPTLPPRTPVPGAARPASFPSSFTPSTPPPGTTPNPFLSPPPAVPPSEYGPIRDIYDPSFGAGQLGGPLPPEAAETSPGRFIGLESRGARRRRTLLSGIATGLAVVLVVGLIAFAVWQTQQGDDDPDDLAGGGTPPAAAGGNQTDEDEDLAAIDGDVAAGAPGTTAQRTPTAEADGANADDDDASDAGAADDAEVAVPGDRARDDGAAADEDDEAAEPTPTPTPTTGETAGRSLVNLVPAEDEVPEGLVLTDETRFDEREVAATFSDPAAAMASLEAWGWRGHIQRVFQPPEGATTQPTDVNFLVVSVHRFESEEAADEALTAFSDEVVALQGLQPIEIPKLGDEAIGLSGNPDEATLVVVYIRTGPYLVRIGGSSPQGDPTDVVIELARVILVNEVDEAADDE
jgi:hypothetical protein